MIYQETQVFSDEGCTKFLCSLPLDNISANSPFRLHDHRTLTQKDARFSDQIMITRSVRKQAPAAALASR